MIAPRLLMRQFFTHRGTLRTNFHVAIMCDFSSILQLAIFIHTMFPINRWSYRTIRHIGLYELF